MMKNNDASYLTSRELEEFEEMTVRAPDIDLTGMQSVAIVNAGNPDAETDSFYVAADDVGTAEFVGALEDHPRIKISNNKVTYDVYKPKLGFDLAEDDIKKSRSWGVPLDTVYAQRTLRAVWEKINNFIYLGDSKYGGSGLLGVSGVTSISGSDWTSGTLDIATDLTTIVNSLPKIYRSRPLSFVLADAEYKKLFKYFNGTGYVGDRSHLQRIQESHKNLTLYNEGALDAGSVLADATTVAAGTALIYPKDQSVLRTKIFKMPYFLSDKDIVGEKVSAAYAARVGVVETPFATAIGKVTGLQG